MTDYAIADFNRIGCQFEYTILNDSVSLTKHFEMKIDPLSRDNWVYGIIHDDLQDFRKYTSKEVVRKMQLDSTRFAPHFNFVVLTEIKRKYAEKYNFFGPVAKIYSFESLLGPRILTIYNHHSASCLTHSYTNVYCTYRMAKLMLQLAQNYSVSERSEDSGEDATEKEE
jgi:hypothetical protein